METEKQSARQQWAQALGSRELPQAAERHYEAALRQPDGYTVTGVATAQNPWTIWISLDGDWQAWDIDLLDRDIIRITHYSGELTVLTEAEKEKVRYADRGDTHACPEYVAWGLGLCNRDGGHPSEITVRHSAVPGELREQLGLTGFQDGETRINSLSFAQAARLLTEFPSAVFRPEDDEDHDEQD